eukprot:10223701-Ditylum_brightwellii.AAC.1
MEHPGLGDFLGDLSNSRRCWNDKMFAGREGMKGTSTVEKNLLLVWGIGPAKAEQGGFGWEALDVLDIPENQMLLMASREIL